MTAYSDFIGASRQWVARPDHTDALMATFVRSAETYLDREMRVKEAITIKTALLDVDGVVTLPSDYNEMVYVRPVGGTPYRWSPLDNFLSSDNTTGLYAMVGDQLMVGGDIDIVSPPNMEMAYYQNIPAFTAAGSVTWLYTKYYDIFLQAVNAAALFYGQEFERSTALIEMITGWVAKANGNSSTAQMSGSPLIRQNQRKIG